MEQKIFKFGSTFSDMFQKEWFQAEVPSIARMKWKFLLADCLGCLNAQIEILGKPGFLLEFWVQWPTIFMSKNCTKILHYQIFRTPGINLQYSRGMF